MGTGDEGLQEKLRGLPPVEQLLQSGAAQAMIRAASRSVVRDALREAVDAARAAMRAVGTAAPDEAALLADAAARLARARQNSLRRAINATGIVLHTNLGRAPLAEEALAAAAEASRGASNLELDLETGRRGGRGEAVATLLRALTGAEAALAVNNNAAAVLLALSALAGGGEVIVSRGELVEIGGGFRIPEVIAQGGARLVEVGTTNRTRLADYRAAIGPATRALLHVHPSNFRVVGFTSAPSVAELAALAREADLPLVEDLGSGALLDLRLLGRAAEPMAADSIAAGATLVAFSGDKLLGGPQAGLLVGTRAAIAAARAHPLARAVRIDKLSLAALEATLRLYHNPDRAIARIPVLRMLAQDEATLLARAERLRAMLGGDAHIEASAAHAGGGALPDGAMASFAVSIAHQAMGADALTRRLRAHRPAVVGRIAEGRVLLDVFAIADAELAEVAAAIAAA